MSHAKKQRAGFRKGDVVTVAAGGTIDRDDRCAQCEAPMLFKPAVRTMFCGEYGCGAWLVEIEYDEQADDPS